LVGSSLIGMKHVDMRKLPAAAQEERRRQVIGLRERGLTYRAIAAQVGLSPTGVFDICRRFAAEAGEQATRAQAG
jgi:transposase